MVSSASYLVVEDMHTQVVVVVAVIVVVVVVMQVTRLELISLPLLRGTCMHGTL